MIVSTLAPPPPLIALELLRLVPEIVPVLLIESVAPVPLVCHKIAWALPPEIVPPLLLLIWLAPFCIVIAVLLVDTTLLPAARMLRMLPSRTLTASPAPFVIVAPDCTLIVRLSCVPLPKLAVAPLHVTVGEPEHTASAGDAGATIAARPPSIVLDSNFAISGLPLPRSDMQRPLPSVRTVPRHSSLREWTVHERESHDSTIGRPTMRKPRAWTAAGVV